MSKTQAERAAEYRQRQKAGTVCRETVTASVTKRDETVTVKCDVTECDAPSVTGVTTMQAMGHKHKPTFDDLPLDVQQEIDRLCYEATGQREGSHSRAAMTERALSYQAMHGKRYAKGTHYDPACLGAMA